MGTSISQIRYDVYNNFDTHERMKMEERLRIMEIIVHNMLERERSRIMLSGENHQTIHTSAVVDVVELVNIIMERNKNASSSIRMVMDSFLSEVNLNEFGLLIDYSVAGIAEKTSVGEYEGRDKLVFKTNTVDLCCDVYYYRWNFVTNSIEDMNGVVGVLLVKRIIDPVKTVHQVLEKHLVDQMSKALEWKQRSVPEKPEGEPMHADIAGIYYL